MLSEYDISTFDEITPLIFLYEGQPSAVFFSESKPGVTPGEMVYVSLFQNSIPKVFAIDCLRSQEHIVSISNLLFEVDRVCVVVATSLNSLISNCIVLPTETDPQYFYESMVINRPNTVIERLSSYIFAPESDSELKAKVELRSFQKKTNNNWSLSLNYLMGEKFGYYHMELLERWKSDYKSSLYSKTNVHYDFNLMQALELYDSENLVESYEQRESLEILDLVSVPKKASVQIIVVYKTQSRKKRGSGAETRLSLQLLEAKKTSRKSEVKLNLVVSLKRYSQDIHYARCKIFNLSSFLR